MEIENNIYLDKYISDNIQDSNPIFITFIIPTIGRSSLIDTIDSLYNLKSIEWRVIIIFDGIKDDNLCKKIFEKYETNILKKIKIIETIHKIGNESNRNSAGLVRNIGIESIDFITEWIGFVDDDDTLSCDYICNLKKELSIKSNIEICIFRMMYENGYVLPTKYDRNLLKGKVGISFAIKWNIANKYFFTNNPFEDFLYLKDLQSRGFKIVISSYVSYYIRFKYNSNNIICEQYPKIFLN